MCVRGTFFCISQIETFRFWREWVTELLRVSPLRFLFSPAKLWRTSRRFRRAPLSAWVRVRTVSGGRRSDRDLSASGATPSQSPAVTALPEGEPRGMCGERGFALSVTCGDSSRRGRAKGVCGERGFTLSVACGDSSRRGRAKGVCGERGFALSVTCGDSSPRGRAKGAGTSNAGDMLALRPFCMDRIKSYAERASFPKQKRFSDGGKPLGNV